MRIKTSSNTANKLERAGQAIVEFAIVLPVLLVLLVGILEVGRMMFIYTAVTNASREASRFGSAVGYDDDGFHKYRHCEGIRNIAERSAYFLKLDVTNDIVIQYDTGPGTSIVATCTAGSGEDTSVTLADDVQYRILVSVHYEYRPMVNLIPIPTRDFNSSSARTILGYVNLNTGSNSVSSGSGGSSSGSTSTPTPTYTPTPTNTSVATATPTNTPTNTPTATLNLNTPTPTSTPTATPGTVITFTPIPTGTVTDTPTVTPTFLPTNTPTLTPTNTPTFTPTSTSTPVPGCGSITRGQLTYSGKTMSMTITNPHDTLTVSSIVVTWNSASGANGNNNPLALKKVTLGGNNFWNGTNTSGSLTIITTSVTIPGNNLTSTIVFEFQNPYQNTTGSSITINLSTPGCEGIQITRP